MILMPSTCWRSPCFVLAIFAALTIHTSLMGCQPHLDVAESVMACAAATDCPPGWRCEEDVGLCLRDGENLNRPSLAVGAIERSLGVVHIPVTVFDRDFDEVRISAELRVGDEVTPISISPDTLRGTREGNAAMLEWDGAAFFAGDLRYRNNLVIRLRPMDGGGQGPQAESAPFAFGNDPPEIRLEDFFGVARNAVPLEYYLQDSAGDLAFIEVQFRGPDDDLWRNAKAAGGSQTGLPTSTTAPGYAGIFVWDSAALPATDLDLAQGIGPVSQENIRVRVRACDEPWAGLAACSLWEEVNLLEVRNQTPCIISNLRLLRPANVGGSGPFVLQFRLDDAEDDPIDIRVELSTNLGITWTALREYPLPDSEGFYHLAAGMEHTVAVDSSGSLLEAPNTTRIRVIATDGFPQGAPLHSFAEMVVAPPHGAIGPALPPGQEAFAAPTVYGGLGPIATRMVAVDLTANGALDLVVAGVGNNLPSGTLTIMLGNMVDGQATGTFAHGATMSLNAPPMAEPVVGDFDGDGHVDIAIAHFDRFDPPMTFTPAGIALYFGNGAGAFTTLSVTDLGGAAQLVAADIDNDGRLDLVALPSAPTTQALIIWGDSPNPDRQSIFTRTTPIPLGAAVRAFGVGDINGDGVLDIVAIHAQEASLAIYLGLGDGTFAEPVAMATGSSPSQVRLNDFDGDAKDDVLIVHAAGPGVGLRLSSEASATTLLGPLHLSFTQNLRPSSVDVADFNGDGFLDVVLSFHQSSERLGVMLAQVQGNAPTGQFSALKTFEGGAEPFGPVIAGHFASSGWADFVALVGGGQEVFAYLSYEPALGLDTSLIHSSNASTGLSPYELAVGDLNRNGVDDAIVVHVTDQDAGLLMGGGTNGFFDGTLELKEQRLELEYFPRNVAARDLSGNGWLDIVALGDQNLIVWWGSAAGFLQSTTYPVPQNPFVMAAGDLNRNGWLDLVVASANAGGSNPPSTLTIFLNQQIPGDEQLIMAGSLPGGGLVQGIELVDLNVDGYLDIVTANGSSDDVYIYLGTNGLGFADPEIYAVQDFPRALAVCDVDGDLALDVVVANGVSKSTTILPGLKSGGVPTGAFGPPVHIAAQSAEGPLGADCADMNGDGYADIAISVGNTNGALEVYFGQSSLVSMAAASPLVMAVGSLPQSLQVHDLNRDGLADVLVVNRNSATLSYIAGQWSSPRRRLTAALGGGDTLHRLPGMGDVVVGVDKFGSPKQASISMQRASSRFAWDPQTTNPCFEHSGGWQPISDAWVVHGEQKLMRERPQGESSQSQRGPRRRVVSRFTGESSLNLQNSQLHDQRGVRIELPLVAGALELVVDADSLQRVVVATRRTHWLRANEYEGDDLWGIAAAQPYLPRQPAGDSTGSWQDLVLPRIETQVICAS